MATYHVSAEKQKNREFKLKYAKRALRHGSKKPREVLTLCGNNVWLESQLARYAVEKALPVEIHGFNSDILEFVEASAHLANLESLPIFLFREKLTPALASQSSFVDFDTCGWFLGEIAQNALDFCYRAEMVALTIIIAGRRPGVETIKNIPSGMTWGDVSNPHEIAKWLASNSPLSHLGTHVYHNPGSACTMATLIFGKKACGSRAHCSEKASVKKQAYSFLRSGMKSAMVAEKTGLSLGTIRAMKAWLHPNLAAKKI